MKKFIWILLAMMSVSCSKNETDVSESLAVISLKCVFNDCTKAGSSSVTKLEVLFIDPEKQIIKRIRQIDSDTNFGSIEETLPCGIYGCVVIGHNAEDMVLSEDIVSFSKTGDTFYGKILLDLTPEEKKTFVMDLTRIVSRIEVVATDAMPAKASFINMDISNASESFDVHTGLAVSVASIQRSFQLKPTDIGRKDIKFAMNVFTDKKNESVLSFSVLDENKKELNSFTTEPFALLPNVLFRFSGHAFLGDQSMGGNINIKDEWDNVIEHELP